MSLVCARRDCGKTVKPDADGMTRYFTVLCAGAEVHQGGSGYVHRDCGEKLQLELVAQVDYLPFCRAVTIAHGAGGGRVSEVRADAYYFCGYPSCLVALLKLYGRADVKQALELAQTDAKRALARATVFPEAAGRQLVRAVQDVAAKSRFELGQAALPEVAPVQRAAPAGRVIEPVATLAEELQRQLGWRQDRPIGSKNVLVVGAGAVGSFMATKLLAAGHRVVVTDRPEQLSLIRPSGFRVRQGQAVQSARPVALVSSLEEAFPHRVEYDLLLLAVKAYDAAPLIRQLASAPFPLPRKVMTVQDGVGAEETAERLLGAEHVLAGSLTDRLTASAAGSVIVDPTDGGLGLAPVAGGEDVSEWARLFESAGCTVQTYDDYRSMKWSKLLLSIVGNATCAILDRPPAVVYRYRRTLDLEFEMMQETLAVVDKMGVRVTDLPGAPAGRLARTLGTRPSFLARRGLAQQVSGKHGERPSSMQIDLAAGRPQSEVAYLNGAVVRQGIRLGISTPVNYLLTDTLDKLFKQLLLWEDFRGRPDALLALRGRQS